MKFLFKITIVVGIVILLMSCNGKPTAKSVLCKSYQKCQSIQGGHYEMLVKKKYMSDNDTTLSRYTCDFKQLPFDIIYGKAFASFEENLDSKWSSHFLYTGDEFIYYNDSTGTVMSCDSLAEVIIAGRHNRTFYTPLTSRSHYPLCSEEELTDNTYTYSLSETKLDGKPCYLVDILGTPDEAPDSVFGMRNLRYEVNLWIDKQDYLPVQYSIAFDVLEQQDTMYQYDEFKLLAFDPNVDSSKLTMESIPAEVTLKDYEPYKSPDPLPDGTPAPEWSLLTLSGDTISLADLKGKVVLLDFFYKSCAPCCAALPVLQGLHEKYKDKGFVMVGIDPIDKPEEDEMVEFLAKRGITYTILFADYELSSKYCIAAYPTMFFLDREGNIVRTERGFSKNAEEDLESYLVELLEK